MTSTYYLLLKRKERVTGKNYVYEQVTFEKRKNLYSTSNLKGNVTRGLELGMNSQQKLTNTTYARSEGRQGISGADVRSNGASSTNTALAANQKSRGDDSLQTRVADIISLPSKAITSGSINDMQAATTLKMAMQTFNVDSIRAHLPKNGNHGNNPRVAQSQSPTQIHRKQNDSVTKNHVGMKTHLQTMNQTFHSG